MHLTATAQGLPIISDVPTPQSSLLGPMFNSHLLFNETAIFLTVSTATNKINAFNALMEWL
jgi:hypothetical protein